MKLLALDIGDQWTGIAISDTQQLFARPLTTVASTLLIKELTTLVVKERIGTIIVGIPQTMRATESQQTIKTLQEKEKLAAAFPTTTFLEWDERLSSKHAAQLGPQKTKEQKLMGHAKAAAFILQSYLDYLSFQQKSMSNNSK